MNKKRLIPVLIAGLVLVSVLGTSCKPQVIETTSEYWEYESQTGSVQDETNDQNQSGTTGTNNLPGQSTTSKRNTGGTTPTSPSSQKDTSPRDLKGRVINYVTYWNELKKGSSQVANSYWKQKEEVEKKFNCKIKFVFKTREAIDAEVKSSILSGAPIADIFTVSQDALYAMAFRNLLYDQGSLRQLDFSEAKWEPSTREISTIDGKVYGSWATPGPYSFAMLMYNIDYFKANNLPDLFDLQQKGKLNWDKLRQIAKDATKGNVKGLAMSSADESMMRFIISANGGRLVSRGKSYDFKVTMNSKNTINAIEFWKKLRNEDKSVLENPGMGYTYGAEQFAKGNAAMQLAQRDMWSGIVDQARFKIGMVLFPSGPDATLPYLVDETNKSMTVMPVNVKNPEDVAAVWDAYAGADQPPWEDRYYDMFNNKDIITSMKKYVELVHQGKYNVDYTSCIGNTYGLGIHTGLIAAAAGTKTPAQAVEEVESLLKTAVNGFLK